MIVIKFSNEELLYSILYTYNTADNLLGIYTNAKTNPYIKQEFKRNKKNFNQLTNFLIEKQISFEQQKTFPGCFYNFPLNFDYYIPSINTCIIIINPKFDNPDYQKTLDIRKNYCEKNKIEFLLVPIGKNLADVFENKP